MIDDPGPAVPALDEAHAALARLRQRAEEAEVAVEEAIDERDYRESQIEGIAFALGCEEEWSNIHDHGKCALEAARELAAERERLYEAGAGLCVAVERVAFLYRWTEQWGQWESSLPPEVEVLRQALQSLRHVLGQDPRDARS